MRLTLSDAAREAVETDLQHDKILRLAFAGGCGALGFRLSTPRRANDGDVRLDLPGATVYLDRQAVEELDGATLDYDEEEGFLLDHPSWGASC